ncbi:4'-phosphopantetheinyl transferase superfamily protein [Lonsdalea populi]|nr:4'-phosphopantetheinyl transferase superfamily protein [Lonsdalea populi]ROH82040.1 4'-phosphopantetheinyl transferase superfamily protein [Lonsdalea populi]ROH82643.1 4'-phosphopantetheinyl transferase superfamily protein [Lonsdalea populi]
MDICGSAEHSVRKLANPQCILVHRQTLDRPEISAKARLACRMAPHDTLTASKLAEGILRCLLAPLCRALPHELTFVRTPFGKPFLPQYPQFHFNLSHTQAAFAFAIAQGDAVGVDVEGNRGRVEHKRGVAKRFFHPDEASWLDQFCDEEMYVQAFIRIWTRKEAYLKALGLGLSKPLDSFSCLTQEDGRIQVRDGSHPAGAQMEEVWFEEASMALSCCMLSSNETALSWRYTTLTEPDALMEWLG